MTMTLEQAQQSFDTLNQQVGALHNLVTQLQTRAFASDEEHKQMHTELVKTQGQLAQANTGAKGEFRLVDPKTMIPEKLGSSKSPWRQWAEDTRAFVAMLSPDLAQKAQKGRRTRNQAGSSGYRCS